MSGDYFNYRNTIATETWERRSFIHRWWRLGRADPRWVPPYYPVFRRELLSIDDPHLQRMEPVFFFSEALSQASSSKNETRIGTPQATLVINPVMEVTVSAAVLLSDPRRHDGSAYLALLQVVNDNNALERLIDSLGENLSSIGRGRIIGPTCLSPHLGSGVLQNYWDELPPLGTPYHPPYLPEVIGAVMQPYCQSDLFHLEITEQHAAREESNQVKITMLEPSRLASDLLPLFQAAFSPERFPIPDEAEAVFMLRHLQSLPVTGWLASVDNQPAGYVLVQPDLAPALVKAGGGKNLLWRLWLQTAQHRPVISGRVLFAGVKPEWRRRGIGSLLLNHVTQFAYQAGWKSLIVGPVVEKTEAYSFLIKHRAFPRQAYHLYQVEL